MLLDEGGGVEVAQVAHDPFDVLKRARVRAFADVRDDFVPRGSKPSEHASPDEASRPRYQTAHARLVTGCAGDTKGTSGGSSGRGRGLLEELGEAGDLVDAESLGQAGHGRHQLIYRGGLGFWRTGQSGTGH